MSELAKGCRTHIAKLWMRAPHSL